jgi:hypothetical protein
MKYTSKNEENKALNWPIQAFKRGDVYYLPHYVKRGAYVSPGFGRDNQTLYYEEDLVKIGAVGVSMNLWKRAYD